MPRPAKESLPPFARRLRALRQAAGLSVLQLADRAGTARQYLYELEAGRKAAPGFDLACRLADALGVRLDDLRR